MPVSRLLRLVLAAAISVAFLAGCGDDDDSADDASDDTTEDTASEDTATDDTTEDTEADDAEESEDITEPVTENYLAFFTNFSADVALLEDGESFDPAVLEGMRANAAQTGEITVDVKAVEALEDADCDAAGVISPCAQVTFDLVVNGAPVVPDQTGFAVYQDDTWKVGKTTFCSLASLSGSTPEGC